MRDFRATIENENVVLFNAAKVLFIEALPKSPGLPPEEGIEPNAIVHMEDGKDVKVLLGKKRIDKVRNI